MRIVRVAITAVLIMFTSVHGFCAMALPLGEKEKKVAARYSVQPSDKLVIDNTYGMVHVNTWDKNEVTVDISVKVNAGSDADAEDILNKITFRQEGSDKGSHRIYYKTVVGNIKNRGNITHKVEIDYTISAPRKIALDLTNKYGDIFLDDFEGQLQVALSYGALSTKNVTGPNKDISIAYGSGNINSIENGHLDISYSNVSIDKAQTLDMNNTFGKLSIESVKNLKIIQRYGNIELGNVGSITGKLDYAGVSVESLSSSADLSIQYCSKVDFRSLAATVSNIRMDAAYSSLYFRLDNGSNLTMDVQTEYGEVNAKGSHVFELNQERKTSTKTIYKGRSGNGKGNLVLWSKYGNISFR